MVNSVFCVTRAGCPWRLLPNDLPPWGRFAARSRSECARKRTSPTAPYLGSRCSQRRNLPRQRGG
ncbi:MULTISPECIES: hypothetical protein [unclassified Bradyrhizobium]